MREKTDRGVRVVKGASMRTHLAAASGTETGALAPPARFTSVATAPRAAMPKLGPAKKCKLVGAAQTTCLGKKKSEEASERILQFFRRLARAEMVVIKG